MASFNAKNLSYEKQEPAFLRRLKGANNAADGRNNVQFARPKKDRLKTGDDGEDDPVILDERGEIVAKSEFEGMQKVEPDTKVGDTGPKNSLAEDEALQREEKRPREGQQIAEVGGPKKRKLARAVGGESSGEEKPSKPTRLEKDRPDQATTSSENDKVQTEGRHIKSKVKKKAKKIKLSFDDPE